MGLEGSQGIVVKFTGAIFSRTVDFVPPLLKDYQLPVGGGAVGGFLLPVKKKKEKKLNHNKKT